MFDRRSAIVALLAVACSKPESAPASAAVPSSNIHAAVEPVASATASLPPLKADAETIKLALEGLGPATVEVPLGAVEARPIVVAVHGHSVRPEHACRSWRRASGGGAFVLCPHGLPADAGPNQVVTIGSEAYTLREINAGLDALRSRFGPYVKDGPVVYAGYSLGARRGVGIVAKHADRFRRVALGEGGYEELQRPVLVSFVNGGVERLLLVCSSRACEMTFGRVRKECEQVGLSCRIAPSGENPHLFAGKVVEATREHWPWLVEGVWASTGSTEHGH